MEVPWPCQRSEKRKESHPSSRGSCGGKWKERIPGPALGKLIGRCETFYPAGPGPPRGSGEGLDCPSGGAKPCLDTDLDLGGPDCREWALGVSNWKAGPRAGGSCSAVCGRAPDRSSISTSAGGSTGESEGACPAGGGARGGGG